METLMENMNQFPEVLLGEDNDLEETGRAIAETLAEWNKGRDARWNAVCMTMHGLNPEYDWMAFYAYMLNESSLEEEWKTVMVRVAMGRQGLKQYELFQGQIRNRSQLLDHEETKTMDDESIESPRDSWHSVPKEKHTTWNGGGLTEWKKWSNDFIDLALEFNYDDRKAMTRMKKYTANSPESSIIWNLSNEGMEYKEIINEILALKISTKIGSGVARLGTMLQGNMSVEAYATAFLKSCEENQIIEDRKYRTKEMIDGFNMGLNEYLVRALPFWETDKSSIWGYVRSVTNMEGEMNRYPRKNAKHKKKRTKHKSKKTLSSVCRYYMRTGTCGYGADCKFAHENSASKNNWKPACKYGDKCDKKDCQYYHKKKTSESRTNVAFYRYENEDSESSDDTEESDSSSEEELIGMSLASLVNNRDSRNLMSQKKSENLFWWDSGCNSHQTFDKNLFAAYQPYRQEKYTVVGDNGKVLIEGWGIVPVKSESSGVSFNLIMEYVPQLGFNLISQSQLDRKGVSQKCKDGRVEFAIKSKLLMTANLIDDTDLYAIDVTPNTISEEEALQALNDVKEKKSLIIAEGNEDQLLRMHERLGHLNTRDLLYMFKNSLIDIQHNGIESITYKEGQEQLRKCNSCLRNKPMRWAKLKKKPKKKKKRLIDHRVERIKMEIEKENVADDKPRIDDLKLPTNQEPIRTIYLSTDFCGPLKASGSGCRYVCVTIAKQIGYMRVSSMPDRRNVVRMIDSFKAFLETHGYRVMRHESDEGGEFNDTKFMKFVKQHGMELYYSTGYDSNANAQVERAIRTICELTRTIMNHMNVPEDFRDFGFVFAEYIRNRCYSRWRKGIPYTMLTKEKPHFKHLYVFGCLAWARVPKKDYGKFAQRQVRCMYLGPGDMRRNKKKKGGIFVNLEKFSEFGNLSECVFSTRKYVIFEDQDCQFTAIERPSMTGTDIPHMEPNEDDIGKYEIENHQLGKRNRGKETSKSTQDEEGPRRSKRKRQVRSITEDDYGMISKEMTTSNMLSLLGTTMKEAMKSQDREKWKEAIDIEMKAIIDMGTRTKIDFDEFEARLSEERKEGDAEILTFKTRFVLTFKEHEKRFKARLVVQSYMWKESRKGEFYSPVVEEATFFLFLCVASYHGWEIESWDAKNAFLHGIIPDKYEIYVYPPQGVDAGKMWRLHRALYGLPIASKLWYEHIKKEIVKQGWVVSKHDLCCFIKKDGDSLIGIAIIHVDDLQVSGTDEVIKELKEALFNEYVMKDVGFGRYCGMNITRNANSHNDILIDMEDYIEKMYNKYDQPKLRNMPYRKLIKTLKKGEAKGGRLREIMGSLLFVTKVRPDIKYIVSHLCGFNDSHDDFIIEESLRVIGYLMMTRKLKLKIAPKNMKLTAWMDADFAGCPNTRKSRNGILIELGGSYLFASSKKQTCNTDSSTYAETKCLTDGCKWVIYFRNFLEELGYKQEEPTTIFQDNLQTIRIIENESCQTRSRGFDINYRYVQDLVKRGRIRLEFVKSRNMKADALSKGVGKNILYDFVKQAGLAYFLEEGPKKYDDNIDEAHDDKNNDKEMS